MMTLCRWSLFLVLVLLGPAVALTTEAQQPGKMYRVGVLWTATPNALAPLVKALEDGLAARGYVAGRNLVLEHRFAEGRPETLPRFARELVALPVDVLVAPLNPVAAVAREATTTIPIVMTLASDPVGAGLVSSLARPGGNITGLTTNVSPEIFTKILEYLAEVVPGANRLAYLMNPGYSPAAFYSEAIESAARRRKLLVVRTDIRSTVDFEPAFRALKQAGVGGAVVIGDPLVFGNRHRLAELAESYRIPIALSSRDYLVGGGSILSCGAKMTDLFRRAGDYIDRILKGAHPGSIPMEQPTVIELVIDLKAAKALGLTIPQTLLVRANEVIQ